MNIWIILAALSAIIWLAVFLYMKATAKPVTLTLVDTLPDTTNAVQWTPQQIADYRVQQGLALLMEHINAAKADIDVYAEQQAQDIDVGRAEDPYTKKLRLNKEHEQELAAKQEAKRAYHRQWYAKNQEKRVQQQQERRARAKLQARKDAANRARREAQLEYWTPERKAQQSIATKERMAIAKSKRDGTYAPPTTEAELKQGLAVIKSIERNERKTNPSRRLDKSNPNYEKILAEQREKRRAQAAAEGRTVRGWTKRNLGVHIHIHGKQAYDRAYQQAARSTGNNKATFSKVPEPCFTPSQNHIAEVHPYGQRALA